MCRNDDHGCHLITNDTNNTLSQIGLSLALGSSKHSNYQFSLENSYMETNLQNPIVRWMGNEKIRSNFIGKLNFYKLVYCLNTEQVLSGGGPHSVTLVVLRKPFNIFAVLGLDKTGTTQARLTL